MTDLLQKFERDCVAAGVAPQDALQKGGLHPTNWWRWKSEKISPTLKSFGKAEEGLRALKKERRTPA